MAVALSTGTELVTAALLRSTSWLSLVYTLHTFTVTLLLSYHSWRYVDLLVGLLHVLVTVVHIILSTQQALPNDPPELGWFHTFFVLSLHAVYHLFGRWRVTAHWQIGLPPPIGVPLSNLTLAITIPLVPSAQATQICATCFLADFPNRSTCCICCEDLPLSGSPKMVGVVFPVCACCRATFHPSCLARCVTLHKSQCPMCRQPLLADSTPATLDWIEFV